MDDGRPPRSSQCNMERNGAMPVPVAMKIVSRMRRAQDEIAEGPWQGSLLAFFHVAKEIGHEAILYTVEAERETVVVCRAGRRSE